MTNSRRKDTLPIFCYEPEQRLLAVCDRPPLEDAKNTKRRTWHRGTLNLRSLYSLLDGSTTPNACPPIISGDSKALQYLHLACSSAILPQAGLPPRTIQPEGQWLHGSAAFEQLSADEPLLTNLLTNSGTRRFIVTNVGQLIERLMLARRFGPTWVPTYVAYPLLQPLITEGYYSSFDGSDANARLVRYLQRLQAKPMELLAEIVPNPTPRMLRWFRMLGMYEFNSDEVRTLLLGLETLGSRVSHLPSLPETLLDLLLNSNTNISIAASSLDQRLLLDLTRGEHEQSLLRDTIEMDIRLARRTRSKPRYPFVRSHVALVRLHQQLVQALEITSAKVAKLPMRDDTPLVAAPTPLITSDLLTARALTTVGQLRKAGADLHNCLGQIYVSRCRDRASPVAVYVGRISGRRFAAAIGGRKLPGNGCTTWKLLDMAYDRNEPIEPEKKLDIRNAMSMALAQVGHQLAP